MLVDAWLTCGITSALPLRSGALEPRTIHREMVGAGRRSLIGGCDQFDSEALIGGIGVPVMILHGTADSNIPITEARRLYAAAREPKTMMEVEGAGHLDAWEGGASQSALKALIVWTVPDPPPPSTQ